ncbi:CaiB/BaiF CoA transferase family protein [Noviherbaspirillum sp. Root189]|uniref:CaiB/BaiF CoA transferase family protein n=1 Tax=Noviherbaspirillum sp. Root189 TaxID=1736487 RepID=UPI00070AB180|nr:CoA transferase [Noviherbaspirillum sp. Root189]KRB67908.1 acyl-CoA transferase [Noviherbaspirillum sp. Root189]
MNTSTSSNAGPLAGLRIVDLSTVVAGPFAAGLLADYGADVIKIEVPDAGDALRALAPHKNGVPLWWKVTNRNKKGVTLDLHREEARPLLAELIRDRDVLVENFRPGTLARWGITKEWLHSINPRLTILRVTGFGQDGPYANKPGFARVFESMSGFTQICGEENGPPLHLGYPISDAVGGLFGAIGVLAALYRLQANPAEAGQEIDCSVTEAMLRVLEFLPIEYDQLGSIRSRSGNRSQYAAPGNVYRTSDGRWASIATSTQSIFVRFCTALNLEHLVADPRFATNRVRVEHRDALDDLVAQAIGELTLTELGERLDRNEVGFSPIYDIADVFADPHFKARQTLVKVPDNELGEVTMQNIVPRFSETPGVVRIAGPALGEHNREVWGECGLTEDEIVRLQEKKVI